MANSVVPVATVQVDEPRTKLNSAKTYAVLKGGNQVTWKPIVSTSYSESAIQFSAPPPNPGIIVDRKMYIKLNVRFTFTGPDSGSPLLQIGVNDAPRAYPVSNIINNLTVTLNNTNVSINMNDVIQPMLRYWTPELIRDKYYSATPSKQDQYQNYSDWTIYGSARNPLARYGEDAVEENRGGFPLTILSNTNTQAVVDATFTEPIFLSPLLFGGREEQGFIGIQTMDFNFSLGNLRNMWSHSSTGNPLTSLSVSFPTAPVLLANYITPNVVEKLPDYMIYPYFDVSRYPTDFGDIASGAEATINSSNIQLQSIPRRMYICARMRNNDKNLGTGTEYSDAYAAILGMSINWNNQSGLLSAATQQDLYEMSVNNGLCMNWAQFSRHVGSVVCVQFGKDIGLSPIEAPGMLGTYQLQMAVRVKNVNEHKAEPINYTLYVIVVSEGTFTVMENRCVAQIGVLSKQEVLDSKQSPYVDYKQVENVYGGSFFSGIPAFIGNAASWLVPKAAAVANLPVVGPALKDAVQCGVQSLGNQIRGLMPGAGSGGSMGPMAARRLLGVGLVPDEEDKKAAAAMMSLHAEAGDEHKTKKRKRDADNTVQMKAVAARVQHQDVGAGVGPGVVNSGARVISRAELRAAMDFSE